MRSKAIFSFFVTVLLVSLSCNFSTQNPTVTAPGTAAADLVQDEPSSSSEGSLGLPSGKLLLQVLDADSQLTGLEVLSLPVLSVEPYPLGLIDGTTYLYPSLDYMYWIVEQGITNESGYVQNYYLIGSGIDQPVKILESDGNTIVGSWSPDSRLVAFGSSMEQSIKMYDVTQGILKTVLVRAPPPIFPSISLAGDLIAFGANATECHFDENGVDVCNEGIFTINLDGSNEVRLGNGVFIQGGADIRWSPDGSTVFAERFNYDITQIYQFDVATGVATLVSSETAPASDPVPSPDNRYLAFSEMDEVSDFLMIRVIGIDPQDNLQERVVTGVSPVWSPDGRYIAYLSSDESGAHIFILEVDSGNVVKAYTHPGPGLKYPLGWLP